jgi:exopolyphosphatase/pppGpp-phosphohydrolase
MCRAQHEDERAEARAAADSVAAAKEEAASATRELEERVAADLAGGAEVVQLQAKLKVSLNIVQSSGSAGCMHKRAPCYRLLAQLQSYKLPNERGDLA